MELTNIEDRIQGSRRFYITPTSSSTTDGCRRSRRTSSPASSGHREEFFEVERAMREAVSAPPKVGFGAPAE